MPNVNYRKKWAPQTNVPHALTVAQSLDVASSDTFGVVAKPANQLFSLVKIQPGTTSTTATGVFYAVAAEGYASYVCSQAWFEGAIASALSLKSIIPQGWTAPTATVPGYLTFTCVTNSTGAAVALPVSRVCVRAVFAQSATPA